MTVCVVACVIILCMYGVRIVVRIGVCIVVVF